MNKKTITLVEGAMLVAVATVLSYIKLFEMPFGGSITLQMLPLVLMGFRRGTVWGLITCLVHGVIQMLLGFDNVLYCDGLLAMIGCALLDYVLAYGVLGLVYAFDKKLFAKRSVVSVVVAIVICGLLRYVCSFLSGWLLWGSYAWEGWSPAMYSLAYNATYMAPNIVVVAVLCGILYKVYPKLFNV